MNELRDLRASYDEELRHLIREVEGLPFTNHPATFEQIARYRAIATSMLRARFLMDEAIRRIAAPHINADPELVDLRQFFTRAALNASYGASA